jgi:methyltransferase (TIGR00027 family)
VGHGDQVRGHQGGASEAMSPGQPSRTMLRTATLRAAHQLLDEPLILNDPIAVGLVPTASEQAMLVALDNHHDQVALRSLFAFRSRFAEDRLAEAAARNVRQYVIVGAGLETFPWRQPDYARGMKIFVADHVATLAWTQVRFWERGLPKPANLTFVPVDLEDCRLGERLAEFGFDPDTPSLCSVLGVMQYIDRQAVDALLRFASSLKAGSEIVFSFVPPDDDLQGDDVQIALGAAERVAAMGEPWKTRLRSRELVERLTRFGFSDVFHLTPDLAQQRYFAGRQDGLRATGLEQVISAIV